jgi:hypothetical protein
MEKTAASNFSSIHGQFAAQKKSILYTVWTGQTQSWEHASTIGRGFFKRMKDKR